MKYGVKSCITTSSLHLQLNTRHMCEAHPLHGRSGLGIAAGVCRPSGWAQPPGLLRRLERFGPDVPDGAVRDSSHFLNET